MQKHGLKVRVIGSGATIVRQVPRQGELVPSGGTVIVYTDGEESKLTKIPNFIGKSPSEANSAAAAVGINLVFSGLGKESSGIIVRSQDIAPNTEVEQGTVVTVSFIHTTDIE
jgi:stage V sporulation protein D (sporulation-specific penicillin-binding protein)